jgi:hypothetical protein
LGEPADTVPIALTPTEYNRTVRDLLGMPDDGRSWPAPPPVLERLAPPIGEQAGLFGFAPDAPDPWPWPLPDEMGVDGFDGMTQGQAASAYQLEELQKAAVHFGAYTLVSPLFFTCSDWDALEESDQVACAWSSLAKFAQRAWRRPLTKAERTRLNGYWEEQLTLGPVDEAIALTAAGIVQSPAFVFRMEQGQEVDGEDGRVRWTGWEMASRLSYFLWDSMPDAELFAAAQDGTLDTSEGVRKQTRRMLRDPRAHDAVVRFHDLWLETDQVHSVSPARYIYGPLYGIEPYSPLDTTGDEIWPQLLGPIRYSMEAEVHLFVKRTLFDGVGTLRALLTDNHGYLSTYTEPIYGDETEPLDLPSEYVVAEYIAASGPRRETFELRPVAFPAEERAGLLTLPAVLALGAHPVHPSPILRGKRVLERLMCTHLGAPPPGAEAALPPDSLDVESTNRQRTEAVTATPGCAACHDSLNPLGFSFEGYDAIGRVRTTDNGLPVDTTGTFDVGGETISFDGGVDLSRQLARHPAVRDCYAQRWVDAAMGTTMDPTDPDVSTILASFQEDDHVKRLLETIATSELFRYRPMRGEP